MGAKARGHRAHINIDVKKVADKARLLPGDGVPSDIMHFLLNDNTLDKIQIQKAVTHVKGLRQNLEAMSAAFAAQRPTAVVMERSGNDVVDVNARRVTAMNSLMQQLGKSAEPDQPDLELGTLDKDDMDLRQGIVRVALLSLRVENLATHDLRLFRCVSKACSQMEDLDSSSAAGRRLKEMKLKCLWDGGTTVEQAYIAGIERKHGESI